jgi:hypothetical protein
VTHPHAYRYVHVSRKFNPWLVIGPIVGFLILMIAGFTLDYQSSLYAFIDPKFSSMLSGMSILVFLIGIYFLFILGLSHVGAIQNHS